MSLFAILAGSPAAWIQSVIYGAYTCGIFSALQAAGATGLGIVGKAVAASVGAGAAAGTAAGAAAVAKKSS